MDVGKKEGRRYVSNFYSNSVEIIPTVPTYLSTLAGAKIARGKASKIHSDRTRRFRQHVFCSSCMRYALRIVPLSMGRSVDQSILVDFSRASVILDGWVMFKQRPLTD